MKMYRAATYSEIKIKEIEITKETAKYISLASGGRVKKVTEYDAYFYTWEEAKQWLILNTKNKVEKAQSQLDYQKGKLSKVQNLMED